jgi:hypothetical protein
MLDLDRRVGRRAIDTIIVFWSIFCLADSEISVELES